MALMRTAKGLSADRPIVVGEDNNAPAVEVISTALIAGLRKGVTRWVTGTDVDRYVENGGFIPIIRAAPRPAPQPTGTGGSKPVAEPEPLADGTPDPLDELDDADEPEPEVEVEVEEDPDLPAKNEKKEVWEAYAALHGVDTEDWTKQDIIDHFA